MKKFCPKCKKRAAFNSNASRHDGLDSWCKLCMSAYHRNYYKQNPDKQREKDVNFDKTHPTYAREYGLRTKYGITEEMFRSILKYQKHHCAICKSKKPGGRYGVWQIDHDHATGTVRGLLCFNCNKHLGFYDRIAEGIAAYLKKPPAIVALGGRYGISLRRT